MKPSLHWALVTGAAHGIGAAIARVLAGKGYPLIVHYRHSQEAAEALVEQCVAQGTVAETIYGDFSSAEGVGDFLERFHKSYESVQVLVNNVGDYLVKGPLETTQDEWQALFQSNIFTPAALCRSLAPLLSQSQGRIINLGCAGLQRQFAEVYSTAYTASKDALWRLTCALAWELAEKQVTVNMVSPGYVDTSAVQPSHPGVLPMGRMAASGDIAAVVAFLVGPEAGYITGQNIEVAGGVRLR